MSKSYVQLLKEIKLLQAHADRVQAEGLAAVIARIKNAIHLESMTPAQLYGDLGTVTEGAAKATTPPGGEIDAEARYRDSDGNQWGGYGPRPPWLRAALARGKKLRDFKR